jgi:hypothetical protein
MPLRQALDTLHVVAETGPTETSAPQSDEKCAGYGIKTRKVRTHNNKKRQPLCNTCNMALIRNFGSNYGELIDDPAAELSRMRDKKETRREQKPVRRLYNILIDLFEEWDLDFDRQCRVIREFEHVLTGMPEAERFFTFHKEDAV